MKQHGLILFIIIMMTINQVSAMQTDQVNSRPRFIFKQQILLSSGIINIGYKNNSFEFFSSNLGVNNIQTTLSGNPSLQVVNLTKLLISGNVSSEIRSSSRNVGSIYQKNNYIKDIGVNEKKIIDTSRDSLIIKDNIEINNITKLPPRYEFFNNNDNYNKIERQNIAITSFISKEGNLKSILLNNSNGDNIGEIFAFRIIVRVFFFRNIDRQFIGLYQTNDFGYGNILPREVVQYLSNQKFTRDLKGKTIGANLINSYNLSKIQWIDAGFNRTLGLDMKRAEYKFLRNAVSILLSNRDTTQLRLNDVSDDFLNFSDELVSTNAITSFDEDNIHLFENSIEDEVLTPLDEVEIIPTINKSSTKLNFDNNLIFLAQFTAVLLITILIIKRKKNS